MENFAIKFEAKGLYDRILWSLEHLFGISHFTRVRIAVPVNIVGKEYPVSEAMGKLQLMIKELPYNEIKELNLDWDALRKANEFNCTERTRLLLEFKAENPTYSQWVIDDSLLEIQNDYCDFEEEVNHCIDYIGKLKEDNPTDKQPNQPICITQSFSLEKQDFLFEQLKEKEFIPNDTNINYFKYVFGGTQIPDNEKPFEKLIWNKSKQLLRELLTNEKIKEANIRVAEIERQVPSYFADEKNVTMKLSKNKVNKSSTPPLANRKLNAIIENLPE
jgi:hypothetical protein